MYENIARSRSLKLIRISFLKLVKTRSLFPFLKISYICYFTSEKQGFTSTLIEMYH